MMPKQQISKPAWVMVANAEQATVYEYKSPNAPLQKKDEITHPLPKTSDIVSDQRGREQKPFLGQGQSYAASTDPKTYEKEDFSREIAHYLFDQHQQYEHLILVASPTILGMVTKLLHKEVDQRLVAKLDKNLTQYNEHTLPEHLQDILDFDQQNFGFDDPRAHKHSHG